MTSRIRDLTLKYDWYICHGNINVKRTFQFESRKEARLCVTNAGCTYNEEEVRTKKKYGISIKLKLKRMCAFRSVGCA